MKKLLAASLLFLGCLVVSYSQLATLGVGGVSAAGFAFTPVTFAAGGMTLPNSGGAIQGFTYTMTGSMTGASTFSPALIIGQIVYFKVCENATGGFTNSYPAVVVDAGPIDTRPSTCTRQQFWFDGTNLQPLSGAISDNSTPGFQGQLQGTLGSYFGCTHGTNATCGVATLASGTVTISTTAIGALATSGGSGWAVILVSQSCSSCGSLSVGTVTAGTSFVVNSTNASDASKVYWELRFVN